MSYTLKQFRYAGGPDSRSAFSNVETKRDSIVMTKFYLNEILSFKNIGKTFDPNKNYFFHGMIKQLPSQQVFYVRLIQDEVDGSDTQYIKTITIEPGNGWVDIEFIFSPSLGATNFNALGFQLQRGENESGYLDNNQRYSTILYLELSEVKNLIGNGISGTVLNKIGVQTRPWFRLCINGQEIRVGHSGVYELRNDKVKIEFLSAVAEAPVGDLTREELIEIGERVQPDSRTISSYSCLDLIDSTKRIIDPFSVDYIFEE